ncbi:hypothetical protein PoB_001734700 [Plakobranchus ocellatus]|uniref:Uncharacterized protein n=1 Tax=Plakobranchus ocellatus TaxID=259542 RepID=A0AAV3Z6E4_9GAST|nr:hypothetical protein PoB_001734700 [Plakobranchus ocellatus]
MPLFRPSDLANLFYPTTERATPLQACDRFGLQGFAPRLLSHSDCLGKLAGPNGRKLEDHFPEYSKCSGEKYRSHESYTNIGSFLALSEVWVRSLSAQLS